MKSYTIAFFYARSKRSGHVPRALTEWTEWTELKGALNTVETSLGTVYGMLTYIQQCGSKIREINKTSSHFKSTGFFFWEPLKMYKIC